MKHVIHMAGALHHEMIVEGFSSCGDVLNGVSVRFSRPVRKEFNMRSYSDGEAGWVLSWEGFETAYLVLKKLKEEAKK